MSSSVVHLATDNGFVPPGSFRHDLVRPDLLFALVLFSPCFGFALGFARSALFSPRVFGRPVYCSPWFWKVLTLIRQIPKILVVRVRYPETRLTV